MSCTLKTSQMVKGRVLPHTQTYDGTPRAHTRELHASTRARRGEGWSCSSGRRPRPRQARGARGTRAAHPPVRGGVLLPRGVRPPPLGLAQLQLQGLAVRLQAPHPGLQRLQLLRVRVLHGGQRRVPLSGQTVELLVPAGQCARRGSRGCSDDPRPSPLRAPARRGASLQAAGCLGTAVAATRSSARHSSHRIPTQQSLGRAPAAPRAQSPAEQTRSGASRSAPLAAPPAANGHRGAHGVSVPGLRSPCGQRPRRRALHPGPRLSAVRLRERPCRYRSPTSRFFTGRAGSDGDRQRGPGAGCPGIAPRRGHCLAPVAPDASAPDTRGITPAFYCLTQNLRGSGEDRKRTQRTAVPPLRQAEGRWPRARMSSPAAGPGGSRQGQVLLGAAHTPDAGPRHTHFLRNVSSSFLHVSCTQWSWPSRSLILESSSVHEKADRATSRHPGPGPNGGSAAPHPPPQGPGRLCAPGILHSGEVT